MKNKIEPVIITFIGPVGVGKSTQITLLNEDFKKNRIKIKKTYIKSVHGLTFILDRLIETLVNTSSVDNRSRIKQRVFSKITPIWIPLDEFNIASKFLFFVYLPYKMGYNILLEEGLLMSIKYYTSFRPYFLGVKPVKLHFLSKLLTWIKNQPHLDIILDANMTEIYKRRKSRSFRRYEKEEFDNLQQIVILKIEDNEALKIDTSNKSINEIHHIIIDKIQKLRLNDKK